MDELSAGATRRIRTHEVVSCLYRYLSFSSRRMEDNSLILIGDDFFDGKHNIVLGGSWATHARIAGRKTL